jgi:DNA-binding beta-propeller fold protein YncE
VTLKDGLSRPPSEADSSVTSEADHSPRKERRGSRVAAIALALTLSAASLTGFWLGFRETPVDRTGGHATDEPVELQPRVTAVVPVGLHPQDVAVGEGAVWVSVPAEQPGQDNLVVRIDRITNEVAARIPVEGYIEELAAGEGGVWGAGAWFDDGDFSPFLVRIDPASNAVVARIPDVSGPLAVGGGALWAVDRAGARAGHEGSSLLRVDPATNQVSSRIPLGVAAWDVEFGEGYVWVLPLEPDPGEGDILQVDPTTSEVVARIEIPLPDTGYPPTVYAPALGEGLAWVPVCCPDNELTLVRVDAATSQIVGEPITVPGGAPFAIAAGHVWFIEERGALYGLNVATLEVDEEVSGFDWPAGGFPDPSTEVDPGQLAVWVTNADQDSVTRIDLAVAPSSDGAIPEGRLVVQLNSGIEVLGHGESRSVSPGGERIIAFDLSPDGSKVLAASNVTEPTHYTREDQLLTIDTLSGERSTLVRAGPTEDLSPAVWSPDGSEVAYRLSTLSVDPATERPGEPTAQTICVVDVVTQGSRCSPDLGSVDGFSWSPDGQHLVVDGVGGDLALRILDLSTGQVSDFASPHDPELVEALGGQPPDSFVFAEWSPSGRYVATQAHLRAAAIFDADGRFVMLGHETTEFSEVIAWSPIRDLLAYAIGRPPYAITDVYVLDPTTGEDRMLFSTGRGEHAPIVFDLAWSPSGRWLAVVIVERTLYLEKSLLIIDVTGEVPKSVIKLAAADGGEVLVGWGP